MFYIFAFEKYLEDKMKRIYGILLSGGLAMILASAPALASSAQAEAEGISVVAPESQEISVYVSGNNVRVVGAAKLTLTIYNLTGTKAASFQIDSDDQTVSTGLSKGIYLLKVGKVVRKVSLS